jgi:hypothetical protein
MINKEHQLTDLNRKAYNEIDQCIPKSLQEFWSLFINKKVIIYLNDSGAGYQSIIQRLFLKAIQSSEYFDYKIRKQINFTFKNAYLMYLTDGYGDNRIISQNYEYHSSRLVCKQVYEIDKFVNMTDIVELYVIFLENNLKKKNEN